MKLTTAFAILLSILIAGPEAGAQTPRGPRYNPGGGGNSSNAPGPSSGHPRGPNYNPGGRPSAGGTYTPPRPTQPSSPSTGSYTGGSPTPRGPRYNPYPAPPTYQVPGHRQGPPVGPNYGRNYGRSLPEARYYRPARTMYNTSNYHRPYGYTPVRYVTYYHSPYMNPYSSNVRYYRTFDWYSYVYRSYPNYIYANWIFWPTFGYNNGYYVLDNYPYYVYNGYRFRYSSFDYCNYQLVDQYSHQVVQTFWNQTCNQGYDICAYERDRLNSQMGEHRYFCAETFRDYGYDYSIPTYQDSNYDGYPDSANYGNAPPGSCVDYDNDGYCD